MWSQGLQRGFEVAVDEREMISIGSRSTSDDRPLPPPIARALPAEQLFRRCDLSHVPFTTVEELEDLPGLVGQERALAAAEFAISIRRHGFNLVVLGPEGTGKQTLVEDLLRRRAKSEPRPPDWCYVNNFADPRRPRCLKLPAGTSSSSSSSSGTRKRSAAFSSARTASM